MSDSKKLDEMNKLYKEAVAIVAQVHADGLKHKPDVMEQVQAIVDSIPKVPQGMIRTLPAEEDSSDDDDVQVIEKPAEANAPKKTRTSKRQSEKKRPPTPVEMQYADEEEKPAEEGHPNPTKRKLMYDVVEETTPEPEEPPNLDAAEKKQKTKQVSAQSSDDMLPPVKAAFFTEVKEKLQSNVVSKKKTNKQKSKKNSSKRDGETDSSDDEDLSRFKADSFKTPVRQPKPLIVPDTPSSQMRDLTADAMEEKKHRQEEEEEEDQEANEGDEGEEEEEEEEEEGSETMVIRSRSSTLVMPRRRKSVVLESRVPKNGPVRKSRPAASAIVRVDSSDLPYNRESVFYGPTGLPMVRINGKDHPVCVPLYNYELHLIRLGLLKVESASLFTQQHYTQDHALMDETCRTCSNPKCYLFGHVLSPACYNTMLLDMPSTVGGFCSSTFCGEGLMNASTLGQIASKETRDQLEQAYAYRHQLYPLQGFGVRDEPHKLADMLEGDTFANRGVADYYYLLQLRLVYFLRQLDSVNAVAVASTSPALYLCIRETAVALRIESFKLEIQTLRNKLKDPKVGRDMMSGLISAHLDIMFKHTSKLAGAEYQSLCNELMDACTTARRSLKANIELFILSIKDHGLAKICGQTKCRGPQIFFARFEALEEFQLKQLASIKPYLARMLMSMERVKFRSQVPSQLPTSKAGFTETEKQWSAHITERWQ